MCLGFVDGSSLVQERRLVVHHGRGFDRSCGRMRFIHAGIRLTHSTLRSALFSRGVRYSFAPLVRRDPIDRMAMMFIVWTTTTHNEAIVIVGVSIILA